MNDLLSADGQVLTMEPKALSELDRYLQANSRSCRACIGTLEQSTRLNGTGANVRLHFVQFDGDNKPKFETLARVLVRHIVRYCLSAQTRTRIKETADDLDEGHLFMLARDLFRKIPDSGETGEILLFFLLESLYEAPQIVCKMELKVNPNDEVKGTDGVHIKWDESGNRLHLFLGESKLHSSIYSALDSTVSSISQFYDLKRSHDEVRIATAHFKHADSALRAAVSSYLNNETSESSCRITHACLIGWDWSQYKHSLSDPNKFAVDFKNLYEAYLPKIVQLLENRFTEFKYRHLSYELMFLPFDSVDHFRREFYRILQGG